MATPTVERVPVLQVTLRVMEAGNGQCEVMINDQRCPADATETLLSRCSCNHLTGGRCCGRCVGILREMKRIGTRFCFRCQNDGRRPHRCEAIEQG